MKPALIALSERLIQQKENGYQFSGQTGSCRDEEGCIPGWFGGQVQNPEGQEAVFATHIEGGGNAHERTARKISLGSLRKLGWLPEGYGD
jgi:beta-lactamase class D